MGICQRASKEGIVEGGEVSALGCWPGGGAQVVAWAPFSGVLSRASG